MTFVHSLTGKTYNLNSMQGGIERTRTMQDILSLTLKDEVRMVEDTVAPRNSSSQGDGRDTEGHPYPLVVTLLATVLILTIVVDILGNLLVILSVFRNRKLRKAGNNLLQVATQSVIFCVVSSTILLRYLCCNYYCSTVVCVVSSTTVLGYLCC